jgi:hypothetical protein
MCGTVAPHDKHFMKLIQQDIHAFGCADRILVKAKLVVARSTKGERDTATFALSDFRCENKSNAPFVTQSGAFQHHPLSFSNDVLPSSISACSG